MSGVLVSDAGQQVTADSHYLPARPAVQAGAQIRKAGQ